MNNPLINTLEDIRIRILGPLVFALLDFVAHPPHVEPNVFIASSLRNFFNL